MKNRFKQLLFALSLGLLIYICLPSLNPLGGQMFDFHDETQLARVHQFVLNLKQDQLPPRLAPELSFNLGFPLFNFYAPLAYWLTAALSFIGLSTVAALKFSFFAAFVGSYLAMFYFLKRNFSYLPSLLGATLYVTSTYFATEIMIRGNLAEVWFLALLPLCLALLIENSRAASKSMFFLTGLSLFALFTVHNIFSLLALPLTIVFSLLLKNKKRNLAAIFFGLGLGAYFLLPALFETGFTQTKNIIGNYYYGDHFLCIKQFWSSNGWFFGPSLPGCEGDMMSFKLGKIHFLLGILGLVPVTLQVLLKKKTDTNTKITIFIALLFLGSLFMTTSYSKPIWDLFSPIVALFQFPWRFMLSAMFGGAYLGAYFFEKLKMPFKNIAILFLIIVSFVTARKYLIKPMYKFSAYNQKFDSYEYRTKDMAYMMPEYISSKADYPYWATLNRKTSNYRKLRLNTKLPVTTKAKFKVLKNEVFEKQVVIKEKGTIFINIHYFPYWQILVNNKEVTPTTFDKLGRPKIILTKPAGITIIYRQTNIEKLGNLITVLSFVGLIFVAIKVIGNKVITD